jgi:hypothetical protein
MRRYIPKNLKNQVICTHIKKQKDNRFLGGILGI